MSTLTEVFGPPISTYSRAQAIEDGVLIDVSTWASAAEMIGGFTCPVAMSAALWAKVQAPKQSLQDTRGRAHDVLWMAGLAFRRGLALHRPADHAHPFVVKLGARLVRAYVTVGPGDAMEPVATILLHGED